MASTSHYYGMWPCSGFWHFLIPIKDFGPIHLFFFFEFHPLWCHHPLGGVACLLCPKFLFRCLQILVNFWALRFLLRGAVRKNIWENNLVFVSLDEGIVSVAYFLFLCCYYCLGALFSDSDIYRFFFFFVSLFETLKLQHFWIYTVKNSNND